MDEPLADRLRGFTYSHRLQIASVLFDQRSQEKDDARMSLSS